MSAIDALYTSIVDEVAAEKQIRHITVGAKGPKKPALLFQQSTLDAWFRRQEELSIRNEE